MNIKDSPFLTADEARELRDKLDEMTKRERSRLDRDMVPRELLVFLRERLRP